MMNIKLLKQGWMTTSGSSLLRMMQNISTPVLDLIVRESLQNSLDAAKENLDNDAKIRVDFDYGTFDSKKLADEFEGISEKLHEFDCTNPKFLSISDTNTIGLSGNLNGIFNSNEQHQHLGKLVFQIMKPQDNEGAGGSWGIGKTVYYRLGIGLIIYYSRTRLDNGEFQNRLVAALVEDETKPTGLLNAYDKNNLGAAFFGEDPKDGINNLLAITNDEYIKEFLSIFGFKPYAGSTTGTKIIIPFVDEDKALHDNIPEEQENLWWCNSVENYLKVAIARWYFPRLSKNYSYACSLLATINNEAVNFDNDIPVFKKFRDMYNAAFTNTYPNWISKISITRERNLYEKEIGWFMYAKLKKEELMPSNLPSPFDYCQIYQRSDDYNYPIIGYCRKPGMIISYRNDFPVKTSVDEFIIGLFVLNSKNKILRPKEINLDEYIRQSEKSDHMYWFDYNLVKNEKQVAIVGNINNQIKNELLRNFGETRHVSGQAEMNTVLAHKFGSIFMPDYGYGNNHSRQGGSSGGVKNLISHKNNLVFLEKKQFNNDGIVLHYKVSIKNKIKTFIFSNTIKTVNKSCVPSKWEALGLEYPIVIKRVIFNCTSLDNKINNNQPVFVPTGSKFEFFKISELVTNKGTLYGYKLDVETLFRPIEFELKIFFDSADKLIQSTFEFELEEDK